MKGKGHGQQLTRKKEAAIAALLSCKTTAAAARKAGIGLTTMYRWIADPAFGQEYKDAREQVLKATLARLEQASANAVDALCRNMKSRAPSSQQVQAAKVVLDHVLKIRLEHSGPGGGAIPFVGTVVPPDRLKDLTDEEFDALSSIVAKVGGRDTDPGADPSGESS